MKRERDLQDKKLDCHKLTDYLKESPEIRKSIISKSIVYLLTKFSKSPEVQG